MRFTPAHGCSSGDERNLSSQRSPSVESDAPSPPADRSVPPPPPRSLVLSLAPLSRRREADFAHVHRRPPTGADTMRTGIYAATRANIKANLFHTRTRDEERLSSHLRQPPRAYPSLAGDKSGAAPDSQHGSENLYMISFVQWFEFIEETMPDIVRR